MDEESGLGLIPRKGLPVENINFGSADEQYFQMMENMPLNQ